MIINIPFLDLHKMYHSGQNFAWLQDENNPNKYSIIDDDNYLEITDLGDEDFEVSCTAEEWISYWYNYFDLDTNYFDDIWGNALKYPNLHMWNAVRYGYGIRILRQNPWQVIVTFIISQNNNMKRIRNSVDALREKYGQQTVQVLNDGTFRTFYAFPNPYALSAKTSLEELQSKEFGLGYRAVYIKNIADFFVKNNSDKLINEMKSYDINTLLDFLMQRKGIGIKVANCIALFGFHHLNCAPIDTHMNQIIDMYFNGRNPLEDNDFRGYEGWAQQILFDYETNKPRNIVTLQRERMAIH